jgi:hypothetical protein
MSKTSNKVMQKAIKVPLTRENLQRRVASLATALEMAAEGASITKTSPRAFCAGRGEIRHSHWWAKHLPVKEH